MKPVYFICNLHAGKASIGDYLAILLDRLTAVGGEVTVHPTQAPGDAIEAARRACDSKKYELLICAGGDGTLNEVIQGCMNSSIQLPIGYIPFGSTNDFARGLGIPQDPEEALDCVLNGVPMACDIGQFNDKYFTYIAAFGAFTEISYKTPQPIKNVLGHAAYILNALAKLPKIRPCRMRIEHDGQTIEGEFLYGMVTNSSSVAKLLSLSEVQWDDGVFEVTLIHKPSNLTQLHQLISAFSKIQLGSVKQYLHYFRASQITVTNLEETPVSWTIDGEYGGTSSRNCIRNLQKAVTFWVDPARREQAEESGDTGLAVIRPRPDDEKPSA